MSSEKNPEVVGCDASIMKNVWEIREREYALKIQLELERLEKSALPSINKDWAGRLAAKLGGYKRVERKAKPPETPTDNTTWKSKQPPAPRPPRVGGSGQFGRPVGQSRGLPTPARTDKEKPVQDKNLIKQQLLMYISQTQPSAMVWGKSWKYNKSLPPLAEAPTDWGRCWMFATQQPCSEAGQPWSNEPNMIDHHNLHLWRKPDYREVESQELDLVLPNNEWEVSWKKSENQNKDNKGENGFHPGFFTMLVESQHHNEVRCSSEWSEGWRATKPANQQGHFTDSNDSSMSQSVTNNQSMDNEMSSKWEESWRFVNHHSGNTFEVTQPKKSLSPEWACSWKAATMVLSNREDTDPSLQEDHMNTYGDRSQHKQSSFQNMPVSREEKFRQLYMQLCSEFKGLSEWNKSWQMTKNNSKPSAEIEKVLKAPLPKIETSSEAQEVEKIPKMQNSTPEKADPRYEKLKHDIIYRPKREFPQSKLFLLKHLEKTMPLSEWRDSWKMIKHRMRMEKRQMRPNPLKPFRESDKDLKPNVSEWKDSWKFTCKPLHQEPDQWQQDWAIIAQTRENGARVQNHVAPFPKNGPTAEQSWGESWRFSRKKHRSEAGVGKTQMSQGNLGVVSQDNEFSWAQRRHYRRTTDWQAAWMVSETQFHHDKPSLIQWWESWKWSVYHTQPWTEQMQRENWVMQRENWVNELMELRPMKEKFSLQRANAKMSRSFDHHMFRERYPEKEWSSSWRAGSLLKHQSNQHGSSGATGQSFKNTIQHQLANEYGSRWGRSFRLANPMPKMDQPWVESYANPCFYSGMWSKRERKQNTAITNFGNPATLKLWGNSHHFLQQAFTQSNKGKSRESTDPRVIMTKHQTPKRMQHLHSNTEKDKQFEKKWAGCHLLGKTQPRPKKGPGSAKKLKPEDNADAMFFEEWAESWRFLVGPSTLKRQRYFKKLIGWDESWKFLIPLYQFQNTQKAK
ncbi:uncharacterized protein LOC114443750 [Parambassis ranga]|uniref:Uncharacterized protein LOC114443750 n=1 Tax=Parambassis ranga TaxID=210632 RepID=A0A6P7JCX5_9TELE|nr:uncharacterized protein LOC114443750 [Parambassis ranga]